MGETISKMNVCQDDTTVRGNDNQAGGNIFIHKHVYLITSFLLFLLLSKCFAYPIIYKTI